MASDNVDRGEVVSDVLARGVPRRTVVQGLGGLGLMAALGAMVERDGGRVAAQDATAEAATADDRSIDDILDLPGVVLVFEWTADGELGEYRAKIDIPEPEIARAARFGSIVASALPTLSETYTELSGIDWAPARWVAFAGGPWSVVVGPGRAVMLETASAGMPEAFGAVVTTADAAPAPAPDDADATEEPEAIAEPEATVEDEATVEANATTEATAEPEATAVAAEATVDVVDFDFDPAEVEITVGSIVTWTNAGEVDHTVTSDDDLFDSGTLAVGDTFSVAFEEAGTFAYHCDIHLSMQATIVVTEA